MLSPAERAALVGGTDDAGKGAGRSAAACERRLLHPDHAAWAAAWSPDPKSPPFYLDLPTQDGKPRLDIVAKWVANMPLVLLDQYVAGLRHLHAIAFDAGTEDDFKQIPVDLAVLDQDLTSYGIPHSYSTYEGNHTDHIANRVEDKVLPYFAKNLSFAP